MPVRPPEGNQERVQTTKASNKRPVRENPVKRSQQKQLGKGPPPKKRAREKSIETCCLPCCAFIIWPFSSGPALSKASSDPAFSDDSSDPAFVEASSDPAFYCTDKKDTIMAQTEQTQLLPGQNRHKNGVGHVPKEQHWPLLVGAHPGRMSF